MSEVADFGMRGVQDRRERIIGDIFAELARAELKHPGWPEDPFIGLAIITEELGETAQAIIEARYRNAPQERVYEEAVQVAAMALRFLFNLQKGGA